LLTARLTEIVGLAVALVRWSLKLDWCGTMCGGAVSSASGRERRMRQQRQKAVAFWPNATRVIGIVAVRAGV
jgi:hypothetical protein